MAYKVKYFDFLGYFEVKEFNVRAWERLNRCVGGLKVVASNDAAENCADTLYETPNGRLLICSRQSESHEGGWRWTDEYIWYQARHVGRAALPQGMAWSD